MTLRQPDLFQSDSAPGLSEDRPVYRGDPVKVRTELHRMLAEARAADAMPWPPRTLLLYRTIFPQMTNWLPDDEAAQLKLEFAAELKRLEAA